MHSWIGANPSVRNAKPCKGGGILRRRARTGDAAKGSVTDLWEFDTNLLTTLAGDAAPVQEAMVIKNERMGQ